MLTNHEKAKLICATEVRIPTISVAVRCAGSSLLARTSIFILRHLCQTVSTASLRFPLRQWRRRSHQCCWLLLLRGSRPIAPRSLQGAGGRRPLASSLSESPRAHPGLGVCCWLCCWLLWQRVLATTDFMPTTAAEYDRTVLKACVCVWQLNLLTLTLSILSVCLSVCLSVWK